MDNPQDGYCDFYADDDIDSFMQKVDEMQIRNESSERATIINDTIQKIQKLFEEG